MTPGGLGWRSAFPGDRRDFVSTRQEEVALGFRRLFISAVAAGSAVVWAVCPARPQPFVSGVSAAEFALGADITLDRAEPTVRTYLKRVDQYVADGSWDEAIQTLRRVMEESGEKLIQVSSSRYITVRELCQLRLSLLPPEGLARYRSQADAAARAWYEEGVARRDSVLLGKVVEEAFATRWADDALWVLGEMALESADYPTARHCWERMIPARAPAGVPDTWLSVPETDFDLAAVRARLVLASILEGSLQRARSELARFEQLHPDSRGWLGGREVRYAEALGELLAEGAGWPAPGPASGWPTFAGSPERNATAPEPADPAVVAWRVPLRPTFPASMSVWDSGRPVARVAERPEAPLSYHPVVSGPLILVAGAMEVLAFDARSGRPPWGQGGSVIFRHPYGLDPRAWRFLRTDRLGIPRFTATVHEGRLYARMGGPSTGRSRQRPSRADAGYLVCLDLEAEGRLVWQAQPDQIDLAFDGSPVTDGIGAYVVMRRSEIQPQIYVVCLDAATGRERWRRFVSAGETPARGLLSETTHTLLTLHRDTLFVNTNVGVVAALSARDGRLKWATLYPRVREGNLLNLAPHWCRDLNPCLYDRGRLLVAPADSPRIFALDAATGQILWQTDPGLEDVVHLLGVAGDRLIASGWRLYWIGLRGQEAGRVVRMVPDSGARVGYGRGIIAGDCVWWPTRERIYVFDKRTGQQRKEISLAPRGLAGGNLFVAGGLLVMATDRELIALGPRSVQGPDDAERVARGR